MHKQQSKYLSTTRVICARPEVALAFGLTKAVIIQQIAYWMGTFQSAEEHLPEGEREHFKDGRWWVYNSYAQWRADNFAFLSESTIKRHILALEETGVLVSAQLGEAFDRTKWYTIDFERLDELVEDALDARGEDAHEGKLNQSHEGKLNQSSIYTETTQETNNTSSPPARSDERSVGASDNASDDTKAEAHEDDAPPADMGKKLIDEVVHECGFPVEGAAAQSTYPRAGRIVRLLLGKPVGRGDNAVQVPPDATARPGDFAQFARWWRAKFRDAPVPRDPVKLHEWWMTWRLEQQSVRVEDFTAIEPANAGLVAATFGGAQ